MFNGFRIGAPSLSLFLLRPPATVVRSRVQHWSQNSSLSKLKSFWSGCHALDVTVHLLQTPPPARTPAGENKAVSHHFESKWRPKWRQERPVSNQSTATAFNTSLAEEKIQAWWLREDFSEAHRVACLHLDGFPPFTLQVQLHHLIKLIRPHLAELIRPIGDHMASWNKHQPKYAAPDCFWKALHS